MNNREDTPSPARKSTSPSGNNSSNNGCKKGPSCHHCRQSHIGCDGQRPCQNCVRKNKVCFDYDKKLIRKPHMSKTGSGTNESCHDDIECAVLRKELDTIKSQLLQTEKDAEDLKTQNQILLQLLNHTRKSDNDLSTILKEGRELQELEQQQQTILYQTPRNEFTLMLWDPPSDLQKPMYMLDTSQFKVIGCNQAFRDLTGFTTEDLQKIDLFEMLPQRLRQPWRVLLQWVLCSSVKLLEGTGIVFFSNNREKCVRIRRTIERNFMRVEYELSPVFSDNFVVDEIHLPETFKIPFDEQMHQNMLAIPTSSYQRLLNLFVKLKSLREQETTMRWSELLGTPNPQQQAMAPHQITPQPHQMQQSPQQQPQPQPHQQQLQLQQHQQHQQHQQQQQQQLQQQQMQQGMVQFKPIDLGDHELRQLAARYNGEQFSQIMTDVSQDEASRHSIFEADGDEENSNELSLVTDCETFDLPHLAATGVVPSSSSSAAPPVSLPINPIEPPPSSLFQAAASSSFGSLMQGCSASGIPQDQQRLAAAVSQMQLHPYQQQQNQQQQQQPLFRI